MRLDKQLIDAVETGDIPAFEDLIEHHFHEILWMKIKDGKTAFDLVVKVGNRDFFELVLEELKTWKSEKMPDEMLDYLLDRSVAWAFFYGQAEIMELALKNRFGVRAKNLNSALTQAVYNLDEEGLNNLICRGASVNAESWYFRNDKCNGVLSTSLSAALERKSASMVYFLLKKGAYLLSSPSGLRCVSEQRDAIIELFSEYAKPEIVLLLKWASIKRNTFRAISEGNILLLYSTLNYAIRDFFPECQELIWCQNSRGFTPLQAAFEKEDTSFQEAITHFIELTKPNNTMIPPNPELMLTAEELNFIWQPGDNGALKLAEEEVFKRGFYGGAEPASGTSNFAEDNDFESSNSTEDYWHGIVQPASTSSLPTAEPRPASNAPQVTFFQAVAPSHPWQAETPGTPSAPPMELLLTAEEQVGARQEANQRAAEQWAAELEEADSQKKCTIA